MALDTTVLIVGAGPTGLLLAAELHRRGIDCRVIDIHPAPLHWDRATVVHPRSLEVFESLGIIEPLLAAGVKQRMARIYSAGEVLGEIDLAICGSRYPFNIGISEEVTEGILVRYLHQHGGDVMRSSKLVDFKPHAVGLIAKIDRTGTVQQVSARWMVGCDGIHSTTRTLCGIELAGHDITEPWAVFDTTLTGWPHSYEANYAYLDEVPVIITALPKHRWRVYLRPSSPDSDLVADAQLTIHRYLPQLGFDKVANPTRFHCHTRVATRYRSGRILLAGDAAHVCSPSQGHGMNSGLQDAFNLAWKLALVCHGQSDPALLDSYEAERRPVAEMITASGDDFESAQGLTDPAQRQARDAALRRTFADAKSRHHESIAEAELDIDYSNSPIVMGDKHSALSPGNRLHDTIEIQLTDGKRGLLHELAHRAGHTALVIGGAATHHNALAELHGSVQAHSDNSNGKAPVVGKSVVISARSGEQNSHVRLTPAAAQLLGIDETTLLVIRPDGHVGLRADRNHLEALAAYHSLLATGWK